MRSLVRLVSLAVVPLGVAACSSGTPNSANDNPTLTSPSASGTTSASATPDPCTMLTDAEVSAAVGAPVGAGKATALSAPLGGKNCTWSSSSLPVRTFGLSVRSSGDITVAGLTTSKLFAQTSSTLGASQALEPQSGLGDAALIGRSFAYVLKGDVLLTGNVGLGTSVTAHQALVTLMTAAAAKL